MTRSGQSSSEKAKEYVLGKYTASGFTIMQRHAILQVAVPAWLEGGYSLRRISPGEDEPVNLSPKEYDRACELARLARTRR